MNCLCAPLSCEKRTLKSWARPSAGLTAPFKPVLQHSRHQGSCHVCLFPQGRQGCCRWCILSLVQTFELAGPRGCGRSRPHRAPQSFEVRLLPLPKPCSSQDPPLIGSEGFFLSTLGLTLLLNVWPSPPD